MSQHLINDFIHRRYIFKPLTGERIINKKLIKYQASNRKNNTSPQDIEESVYDVKSDKHKFAGKIDNIPDTQKRNENTTKDNDNDKKGGTHDHIDIIV